MRSHTSPLGLATANLVGDLGSLGRLSLLRQKDEGDSEDEEDGHEKLLKELHGAIGVTSNQRDADEDWGKSVVKDG
jgi:hypothetical protein